MTKFFNWIIVLLILFRPGYSQISEFRDDSGFERDSLQNLQPLSVAGLKDYIRSQPVVEGNSLIGGQVASVFHELVDSALISVDIDGIPVENIRTTKGLFVVRAPAPGKESLLDIRVTHPDFHAYDTSFVFSGNEPLILNIKINPKHKILLRGRVYAGNIPLEGVNVEIMHEGKKYFLKTRGCFYDDEDYWNCLFDGMFKQELIAENPEDSIQLLLTSTGMKPYSMRMKFSDYSGEVMHIKMKYAPKIPEMPVSNLNLKLAFPFATSDNDWFVAISYYRLLNAGNLKRVALGLDASMYVSTVNTTYPTLPGLEPSTSDSSYITGFIGPSLLVWVISPDRRKFSTYAGCTFSIQLSETQFVIQPFIGTRYFLDINKAVNLEIRYSEYDRDVIHYEFNPYGNITKYAVSEHFVKFHVNLGVQIIF
jgi:hypothetical protein